MKKEHESAADKLKFYFSLFDVDSNGILDKQEFRALVRNIISEEPNGSTDKVREEKRRRRVVWYGVVWCVAVCRGVCDARVNALKPSLHPL